MKIIPCIETPVSGNYKDFIKELASLCEVVSKLNGNDQHPSIIIEQNFGINSIIISKELMEAGNKNKINVIYAFNMRDKNRIAIFSDLVTLNQLGLRNIIISEGLHPVKTSFYSAKPVYDIDSVALSSAIKLKTEKEANFQLDRLAFKDFNLGVMVGASTPVDLVKIKKLVLLGVDSFIINSFLDNVGAIKYIKSRNRECLINVKETGIKSLDEGKDKAVEYGADGLIVKIMNEKTNIFNRF